jgi:hypothetical protein
MAAPLALHFGCLCRLCSGQKIRGKKIWGGGRGAPAGCFSAPAVMYLQSHLRSTLTAINFRVFLLLEHKFKIIPLQRTPRKLWNNSPSPGLDLFYMSVGLTCTYFSDETVPLKGYFHEMSLEICILTVKSCVFRRWRSEILFLSCQRFHDEKNGPYQHGILAVTWLKLSSFCSFLSSELKCYH